MKLRYFFKFDDDGSVDNWQVAETNDGAAKLIAADYTEVTADRYIAHLKRLDYWQMRAMWPAPLNERTV